MTVEKDRIDFDEDDQELAGDLPAMDDEELEAAAEPAIQAMEVEDQQAPQRPQLSENSRLRRIDYDEFERTREFLVSRVRRQDEDGIRLDDLVAWYLLERESEIAEAGLDPEFEEKVVRKIIRRLMKKEHVLMAINHGTSLGSETQNAADTKNPFLVIHPEYISPDDF